MTFLEICPECGIMVCKNITKNNTLREKNEFWTFGIERCLEFKLRSGFFLRASASVVPNGY